MAWKAGGLSVKGFFPADISKMLMQFGCSFCIEMNSDAESAIVMDSDNWHKCAQLIEYTIDESFALLLS